jgi:3-hydroxyisobutyrate dehydrogenase
VAIGFIGLGRMGTGMASNMARAGCDLVVFDQRSEATDVLRRLGADVALGVADVARRCDLVFTSLPGPAQIELVVFGRGGLYDNLRPGLTHFDLSTSSLDLVRRIHRDYQEKGAVMLDAPVSGGPAGAASGDLVVWVGGERGVFERHLNTLSTFTSKPHYVGTIGAGTVTKLANNVMGYMLMQCMAEAFSVAVKAGLDPLDLWQSIRLGMVGKSSPLDMLVRQFLPGSYDAPAMALELAHKDVRLATDLGRDLGVPMRMANMTFAEITEAIAQGMGGQDSRAYLKLQLARAGVEIAVDPERLRKVLEAEA